MSLEKKQKEAFRALKAFNNAVTTSRLYPASSPQVANTNEKAYQVLKQYGKDFGVLSFGRRDDDPLLCGVDVPEEIHSEFSELLIYRHLNLLKLDNVVLSPPIDHALFKLILSAFVARKEAIDGEGGGRPFADNLGLEHIFPDEYNPPPEQQDPAQSTSMDLQFETPVVTEDLLDYLFGESNKQERLSALQLILSDRDQAVSVIAAGVARLLREAGKQSDKNKPFLSPSYSRFFENTGNLLQADRDEVITGAVALLLRKLNDPMLAILHAQKYAEGFPQHFLTQLTATLPNEQFDAVMRQLHRWVRQYVRLKNTGTVEARTVGLTLQKLLASTKGKQFVGREKARALIQSGEQERKEKRIETGIGGLLRGGKVGLKSDEILLSLPAAIGNLVKQGEDENGARLIKMLSGEMLHATGNDRQRLIRPIVLSGEILLEMERWELLELSADALLLWISSSSEGDTIYKKALLLLQSIINQSWDSGNYVRGDQILPVFHQIRTGQLPKDKFVVDLVGRIQDRSYNRSFYQKQLTQFLDEGGNVKAGRRLIMSGRPAGDFIVEKLLQEEEPANRLKIVGLLGDMGSVARELIIEKLPEPMPWYGKRNLIKLAGVMASPEQIPALFPYLRHDDIRVQREAFVSIYTISGEQRKETLIQCLGEASEAMLCQVVKALLPYSDDETIRHLGTLLEDQENFSADIREPLIRETIKVISRSSSETGRDVLLAFLDTQKKKVNRRLSPAVWQDAERALRKVEEHLEDAAKSAPQEQTKGAAAGASLLPHKEASDPVGESSQQVHDLFELPAYIRIKELVEEDKIDSAKESLLWLIGNLAAKHRFEDAETLRTWLVEIDPMALSEIIRAAEIIEEEKIASIAQMDIEAWSELYDELSTEEFATFIHATERKVYGNEALIFQQGDTQSGLYFVNSGAVKIFYQDKTEEKLIKTATRGDILGADTVVDASVWTVSAACLGQAEIMYLGERELVRLREEYPALETKINDFCQKYVSLEKFFNTADRDRRGARRHNLSGKVTSVLLDDKRRDTGFSTQGDLSDVSRGGLSFFMRISQKKHARVMLGRNIRVMVAMEGAVGRQLNILGSIIAVRSRQNVENEYSVHIKFNENLSSPHLQAIIKTNA